MNDVTTQTPAAIQPTPDQIDQYHSLQEKLHGAAYDQSVILTELVVEAKGLTQEQRQALTDQAMEMIERGELQAEQFINQAGS